MKVKEFIEQVYIKELGEVVYKHKYHYLSFSLICMGIEFIGACICDDYDFKEKGLSEKRFKGAILNLFSLKRYKGMDKDFYSSLRCSLLHYSSPGIKFGLTHREESKKEKTKHLKMKNGKIILVCEDLYDDFKKACEKVIEKIDKEKIESKKVYKDFLSVN